MRLRKTKRRKPSVIYSPFDLSDPVPAGVRRFWKQVLPVTSIEYKGQEIDFDPSFHMDLSNAFKKNAFDQVPVVFANADNAHNMDPRNFGGDVLAMEYRGPKPDQGTWALIEADKKAAKAIAKNPKLGVSARIRQGVRKSDGRRFPRAIEHICLTMNPRVTGMGPWQAVDLTDDADFEVVDLTAVPYTEGKSMRKTRKVASTKRRTSTKSGKQPRTLTGSIDLAEIDLSDLSDEQFDVLLDLTSAVAEKDETETKDDKSDKDAKRKTKRKRSKTKITVEKDSESDDDDLDDDEDLDADLTDEDETETAEQRRERRLDAAADRIESMAINLAEDRWEKQKESYLASGVPAFLIDLAEPVLSLPDSLVIDLSDDGDGEEIDASAILRKMLDGVSGVVDLTDEIGHGMGLEALDDDKDAEAFDKAWAEGKY